MDEKFSRKYHYYMFLLFIDVKRVKKSFSAFTKHVRKPWIDWKKYTIIQRYAKLLTNRTVLLKTIAVIITIVNAINLFDNIPVKIPANRQEFLAPATFLVRPCCL